MIVFDIYFFQVLIDHEDTGQNDKNSKGLLPLLTDHATLVLDELDTQLRLQDELNLPIATKGENRELAPEMFTSFVLAWRELLDPAMYSKTSFLALLVTVQCSRDSLTLNSESVSLSRVTVRS
jgi:hypothetical protein